MPHYPTFKRDLAKNFGLADEHLKQLHDHQNAMIMIDSLPKYVELAPGYALDADAAPQFVSLPKALTATTTPYWATTNVQLPDDYIPISKEENNMPAGAWKEPKTQKAKGILIGARYLGSYNEGLQNAPEPIIVFPSPDMGRLAELKFPAFARPCPKRPRHGFVESRKVKDLEEALRVWGAALKEDKDAELVLMPVLTGRFSGVATNAGVSWGQGNDAVTGGKDAKTIPVPMSGNDFKANVKKFVSSNSEEFKDLIPNHLYMELVEHKGRMRLVQLRDGPEQPTERNYIPKAITVAKILDPDTEGDLLDWERKVLAKANSTEDPASIVIRMPGASLASHWAVHAIQAGMTVITDGRVVCLGDHIKPELAAPMHPDKSSGMRWELRDRLKALAEVYTFPSDLHHQREICATAVATIHSLSTWNLAEHHLSALAAYAVDSLVRLGLAACAGEMRHRDRYWADYEVNRGAEGDPGWVFNFPYTVQSIPYLANARDVIYREFLGPMNHLKRAELLDQMVVDFDKGFWPNSYGGPAWGQVAEATARLARAVDAFQTKDGRWAEVVMAANNLIHTSHNSDLCLTKWCDIDAIAQCPTRGFMNCFAAYVATRTNSKGYTPVTYGAIETETAEGDIF